jgi:nitrite reductase/ring-hydroxylating ferredoxin subunit
MCDGSCPLGGRAAKGGYRVVAGPTRREFLAQSTLAAIALVLTACGDGEIGGVAGPPPVVDDAFTIRLADFPALAQVGGIARVDGGRGTPIALSRLGPSTFAALAMVCTHAGYEPILITSGAFRCPNHGARFAADGSWTGGQSAADLFSFPTAYDAAAGTVRIG